MQYDPTNIYTLLTKDANMYLNYNIFTLNNIFHIVLNVVFSIIVGAAFSWILIIFILIVISFSFIGSFLFKKTQRNAFDKYSEANHQFQTKINNLLDGYSRLYFANKQNLLNEQLSSEINSVYETSLKKNNIVSFVQLGSQRIYEFIGGALIIGSAILIFHFSNQSTFLGVIDIAFLTLITAFVGRLKSFGPNLLASIKNYLSNRNIVKKFNLNLEPETNASTIERVENIKLLNLDFKYPESDKKLFQNLNLDLKKGQKYAIIGESGSGNQLY
ncbi:ABC transporter transmembrane domain-containing protein [Mycoplasmoides fastidiosum]|uniref:ABC transporter transmembrane domain-containing protein n=1 Tax=Mycoplasmoides fastidiosum TaxID=92758 RepID=UPI002113E8FA|nr:ABC transporter transmembrane domain-containing protein [Mycoplasmoides fastidiosum]UUD37430.1 ABC transporter transmembrane domain-containing protein [Mycoplasmoides fastidiosum]